MNTISLEFGQAGAEIGQSLSALVCVGDSMFAAGDEGVAIARLEQRDGGERFELEKLIDLGAWFDLPIPPNPDQNKVKELDVEGLDFDPETRLLWLVGSHSLKRGKVAPDTPPDKRIRKLGEVKLDGNRYFLGCVKLASNEEGKFRLSPKGPNTGKDRAAQLRGDATSSELLDELRKDELFARFCATQGGIPGKDNGLDIEGLACAPGGRLLVGLRGPVLRGISVVLELAPRRVDSPGTIADRLQLAAIGPNDRKYRRHFLDLAGRGIRDLCWHGDDLLILAGPTMDLDAPPFIFRWRKAKEAVGKGRSDAEDFFWRSDGTLLGPLALGSAWQQAEPGKDHAEALTLLGNKRLAIGYDSPSEMRHRGAEGTVAMDVIPL